MPDPTDDATSDGPPRDRPERSRMTNSSPSQAGTSLRRAVLIALLLGVVTWVAASFAIARNILVDSMIRHELDDGDALGGRLLRLVDVELARLEHSARDWATWDETWAFARGEDDAYVERNVYDEALQNLKIDMMAVVGANGDTLLVRIRDGDAPAPDPVPTLLGRDGAWREPHRTDQPLRGIVRTTRGPLAFVGMPIHRSQPGDPGPGAGTLVFGRFLDETFVDELRRILRASLTQHAPDASAPPDVTQALRRIGETSVHVVALDDTHLVTHAVLRDLWGQPVTVLRAISERSAYAQAQRAEHGLLLASLAIGLAAGLGFYGFMASRVLAPLQRLDNAVRHVGHDGGRARLPPTTADDEFARLGRSVNAMLDELDTQRDAREARDAAQLASRMKGEWLINLGQTTTLPLAALRTALEAALRDDGLSPPTRAQLDAAYRAAFRLATELRRLPEPGSESPAGTASAAAPFDLRALVENLADAAAARGASRGVAVDCEIDPALGSRYLGDASRLQAVLTLMTELLEYEMPTEDLLLRARLVAAGARQDSIEISLAPGAWTASNPSAAGGGHDAERAHLRQAVAALGGLLLCGHGRLQLTLQWPRVDGDDTPGARPHAGRRVLVLGSVQTGRDIVEAYLKALGCQVVATPAVLPTTPRDLALAVVLVDEAGTDTSLETPLPGIPTLFILPTGAPPPAARPGTACVHRPLRWSALKSALGTLWPPSPAAAELSENSSTSD